jgi:hypothetical protein
MMVLRVEDSMGDCECLREEKMHRKMAEECLHNAIRFANNEDAEMAVRYADLAAKHLEAAEGFRKVLIAKRPFSLATDPFGGFEVLEEKRLKTGVPFFYGKKLDGFDLDADCTVCPFCGSTLTSSAEDKK